MFSKPWLVWLSGLTADLQTQRSPVRLLVWAHTRVASQVLSWGCGRGNQWMFLILLCFYPCLSPSLPLSLQINKRNLKNNFENECSAMNKGRFWDCTNFSKKLSLISMLISIRKHKTFLLLGSASS